MTSLLHLLRCALAGLLLTLAGSASAQLIGGGGGLLGLCSTRITELSTLGNISYLPFSAMESVSPVRLKVSGTLGCGNLTVTFRSQNGNQLGGRLLGAASGEMTYQVRFANGRVARLDGIVGELLSALLSPLLGSTYEFFIVVPPGQVVLAGPHSDRLVVEIANNGVRLDSRDIPVVADVQPQARISLEGSVAGGFTPVGSGSIDFGVLETGKERSAYLFVNANANCALQIRSANGGRLIRVGGDSEHEQVAYTASVGGVPIGLATPASLPSPVGASSFLRSMELRLRLGTVDWQVAGSYRDTITVDLVIVD